MIIVSQFWSESIVTVYGLYVFQSVKYTDGQLGSVELSGDTHNTRNQNKLYPP